ncbi:MAG: site-2 protease family protein [Parachlamydiaceae bacterium]|nr:site-2 protease family protein [Parachlamydiaceae bacterium]
MIKIPGKIPVIIHPLFWFLILAIGWMNSATITGTLIWSSVILFSVLIHEYGHALTAVAFGQTAEINLVGLGGLTTRKGPSIKAWQEFLVILNGPLAGLLLFVLVYKFSSFVNLHQRPLLADAIEVAIYVNLFWTLLNLLPILPLDGGHLMRVLLEGAFGFNGIKFSLYISIFVAVLGSLLFFFLQSFLAGALFLMFAFESYRTLSEIRNVMPHDSAAHLQELLQDAQEDLKAGKNNEALAKFFLLREQTKEGLLFVVATQNIARILAQQGHLKQAYDWLLPLEKQISQEYLRFLQQLAYRLEEWEKTVDIGTRAYQNDPRAQTAFLNAVACAVMGQVKPAVGWLRCSLQMGLPNFSEVVQAREFDSIRHSKEFEDLMKGAS